MLLQDIFSQSRLNLKKFLIHESFLGGNTSPDNTQPLSKSPEDKEDKEDKETKQIAEAIKTAFTKIQCQLREQGYGKLLNYLADPTNLDRANIPSSRYFLLINGMENAIAGNIMAIQADKRLDPN